MAQIILFQPSNGKLIDKIDKWPPWALLYASAKLDKEKYSIKIIDERHEKDWEKILDKELNEETICVGVTAMTGLHLKHAINFLREVKNRKPDIKTVMGGIHATADPCNTIKNQFIDFVVRGDGDIALYNLVRALEKNESVNEIITADFVDLNEIEDPPLHLINIEKYISIKDNRRKFIIFTSRGCPFGCYYCYNGNDFNKNRWRGMSAEKVFNFITELRKKYGISYIIFQDDEFCVDRKRFEKFASLIKNTDTKWAIHAANIRSLKHITPEEALELRKSGLRLIICGIETVSPEIQKAINKHIEIKDFFYVNDVMTNAGIKMGYSFMSGFPGETNTDIKMNVDTMIKIIEQNPNIDVGNIKPLVYFPGTKLFDWAIKNGFKPPQTLEEWSDYSWHNYDKLNYPWLSKKRKRFLQNLYFATFLLNPDYEFISKKKWKYICRLLMPITKWRLKNLNLNFSPVLFTLRFFKKMNWI